MRSVLFLIGAVNLSIEIAHSTDFSLLQNGRNRVHERTKINDSFISFGLRPRLAAVLVFFNVQPGTAAQ